MEHPKRNLGFSVDPGLIQDIAREKYKKGDLAGAIRFIAGCISCDGKNEWETKGLALAVLEGTMEMRDGAITPVEKPDPALSLDAWNKALLEKSEKDRKTIQAAGDKLAFLAEELPEHIRKAADLGWVNGVQDGAWYGAEDDPESYATIFGFFQTGKNAPPSANLGITGTAMVESFLLMEKRAKGDDYGWLFPDGRFFPVEWGDHQDWARKWLEKHDEEYARDGSVYMAGDTLCQKYRAILVHSPSRGVPIATGLLAQGLTKAQKDFLWQYYIDRDLPEEAAKIYPKEEN